MTIGLTLDGGTANIGNLAAIPRMLMLHDPDLQHFVAQIREVDRPETVRAVQIDLDAVYDPDPVQQERNLDALIKRIYTLGVNVVMLQAFADPDGSGLAKAVYFPNRWLPVRADLFNRVAWQLRSRGHVHVYGWLPVLSYDFAGVPADRRTNSRRRRIPSSMKDCPRSIRKHRAWLGTCTRTWRAARRSMDSCFTMMPSSPTMRMPAHPRSPPMSVRVCRPRSSASAAILHYAADGWP
jgi:poly-beta-1,6-N-acetyl-D-glucosamine N-deacetylase PgaB